jgi:LPS-assembly lipoprotein
MWFFKPFCSCLIVLLLSGCGFKSLYSTHGKFDSLTELSAIKISLIPERSGQQIRNELLDLLTPHGAPQHPHYILNVTVSETKNAFAVKKNAFATRADLRLTGNFNLLSSDGRKSLTSGKIFVISSYDIISSDFATLSAEKNARERCILQLSEDIRSQLAVYFVRQSRNSL